MGEHSFSSFFFPPPNTSATFQMIVFFLLSWTCGWLQEYQWFWPFHPYIHICFGGRGHTTPSSNQAAGSSCMQQELLFKPTGTFSSPSPVFHIPSSVTPQDTYWKEGHPWMCPCPVCHLSNLSFRMEFPPVDGDAVSHHDFYSGTSKPQSNGGTVKKHLQNLQVCRKVQENQSGFDLQGQMESRL